MAPAPNDKYPLWTLFWAIGILMGLFARELIDGPNEVNTPKGMDQQSVSSTRQSQPSSTMVVQVRAVLELPTATATSPPTPTETPVQQAMPYFCATPEAGKLCRVPYPPPPTPTPYPSCTQMHRLEPGSWCIWPTEPAQIAGRTLGEK